MDSINRHHNRPDDSSKPIATHCVFRRGLSWLALPATAVREAMPRPEMFFVPGTPETFVGLCHVRSEFIPVLNLDSVLSKTDGTDEKIMLVLDDTDGPWAVLVDEVTSLRTLELSDAPETDDFAAGCAVVGWATHDNRVIQILDQTRIRQTAERELDALWQSTAMLHAETVGAGNQN